MKTISILGSTGSIGVNTLDVVERNPAEFKVCGLSAGGNIDLLAEQARKFRPRVIAVFDPSKAKALKDKLSGENIEIVCGQEGNIQVASLPEADLIVSGIVGSAGLESTLAGIEAGKDIALANKETLVVAGELVLKKARGKSNIIPVDSEHSAIFQALNGESNKRIRKIVLTASGGPFRTYSKEQMDHVTVADALNHPNWKMGAKITIDSATMMNKGLEYIEAKWLFGVDTQVDIVVHAQSIIHSMVEFVDTSIMAQLGIPDMRVPIAYALSYPDRLPCELESLDLAAIGKLTFEAPDYERFPCLKLAQEAMEQGQTIPAVLNAANEIAVDAFLNEQIAYKDIAEIIRSVMHNHAPVDLDSLEVVLNADAWAREEARKQIAVAAH
ncbi:MAG: 1-deoxy-D-xylulose-5-phosphate reductoisomerase [Candidatus Nitrohelix vancouverensis]|uniref:1-deoxy-D-xylulose 5-phosphate reductoisomerase n=1 Tax=Candidatus Nitrohelix vancouverensis TaxID=2705534 RepID=A0A7T0C0J4_9BACT|nr:MAG: 1-deoxy-D-xylulose-5-phosphate reductoisomerase [Candidatus Nitrohelix vancouverensis]